MSGPIRPAAAGPVLLFLGVAAGCTEQPLGSTDPESAPGTTAPTLEFVVPVEDFPMWRDTTVAGFVTPQDGSFLIQANQDDLRSRVLGRFAIPEVIETFTDTLPPDEFVAANVLVRLDTLRSVFPEEPIELRLHALQTPFDAREATWEEASSGVPWMMPGGDLGPVLGRAQIDMSSDTTVIEFEVPVDALLDSWVGDGEPGVAMVIESPATRLQITRVRLRFDVILEGREVPIASDVLIEPVTFIADPPQPPTGLALRLLGLPAARSYFDFVPPDTIDGVPVRGSAINHAELQFVPMEAPEGAYRLERSTVVRPIVLLGDPFAFGEKTPVGPGFLEFLSLEPAQLDAGNILKVNITQVMDAQALLPPDSVRAVQLGIRGEPDDQSFGFWEFGSIEAPPGMRPRMVIVLTPRPDFRLP